MSLSLFFHIVDLETKKLMSYRVDFWITMVVNLVVNLVILWALWTAIFAEDAVPPQWAEYIQKNYDYFKTTDPSELKRK